MTRTTPTMDLAARLAAEGATWVVGLDEVGRGALAGPVMIGVAALSAARIKDGLQPVDGVRDSKQLTPRARQRLLEPLESWCDAWAVGEASNQEIDQWGMSRCLGLASARALSQVVESLAREGRARPAGESMAVIVDGPYDYVTPALAVSLAAHSGDEGEEGALFDDVASFVQAVPAVSMRTRAVTCVRADTSCAVVSTASVIAKVTRDRLMEGLAASDARFAPYEWERNKGYGTRAHRAAIAELGPTSWHRVSWHLT